MSKISGPFDQAILEVDQLRKHLKKQKTLQVKAVGDLELIRAYSLAWSHNHRNEIVRLSNSDQLTKVDGSYQQLLTSSYKATARSRYQTILKELRGQLLALQTAIVSKSTVPEFAAPNLGQLVQNPQMALLVNRRMQEVLRSLDTAPLSATIMMGALLEALFLARINLLDDKRPIFSLKSTPKDKTGKARELKDWTLNDFIEVSHEIGWIRRITKDISTVLRDYRNVIHPVKELTMMRELKTEVLISPADARMLWRVFSELSQQISASV